MPGTLVIVPCGQRKIWNTHPHAGPTPARDAYTGSPFKVNCAYAERFGDAWLVLSAKYGFIAPDFLIPGPYNVTFKRRNTRPIDLHTLRTQVKTLHLDRFDHIVVLGGADYRCAVREAFAGIPITLSSPAAGLGIGKAMQHLKRAIADTV